MEREERERGRRWRCRRRERRERKGETGRQGVGVYYSRDSKWLRRPVAGTDKDQTSSLLHTGFLAGSSLTKSLPRQQPTVSPGCDVTWRPAWEVALFQAAGTSGFSRGDKQTAVSSFSCGSLRVQLTMWSWPP